MLIVNNPTESIQSYGSNHSGSHPGSCPAEQSEGVALHGRSHHVHPNCPPAPAVVLPLRPLDTPLHLAVLQPQDEEALGKVVHGLKADTGQIIDVKGGGVVVAVQQNAL